MSEVTICNLALGHLGDGAAVTSINPPDGSAQAAHCARFYALARNTLLEGAAWNFATRRATLAAVTNPSDTWQFAYALPANCLKALAVLPTGAGDDYEVSFAPTWTGTIPLHGAGALTPQPYVVETDNTGQKVLLTNVEDAILRYVATVTDTTQFSSLFTVALSWLLASMLAGPIIKGDTGAAEAKRCLGMFQAFEAQAKISDANQRRVTVTPVTAWIAGR